MGNFVKLMGRSVLHFIREIDLDISIPGIEGSCRSRLSVLGRHAVVFSKGQGTKIGIVPDVTKPRGVIDGHCRY